MPPWHTGAADRGRAKVFVGSFDARLVALDAATGQKVWEKDTSIDRSKPYTITGAPRVFKGKVIIGNGGAEGRGRFDPAEEAGVAPAGSSLPAPPSG